MDNTKPLYGKDSGTGRPGRLREGDEVGSYLVLAHLFTGGMGEIYAAVHQQADMLQQQVDRQPPPLSTLRPEVARGGALDRLVMDCLEKRPGRRPPSMIAFLGRLDEAEVERCAQVNEPTPEPLAPPRGSQ